MGLPLLRGRLFDTDKGAVVINRAMADKYWPGRNAIGRRMSSEPPPALPDLRIVGIVGNTRHRSLSGEPVPEFYQPYRQYLGPAVGTTLVLRTFGDPNSVAASLRQAIHRFDPEQVVENEITMEATVEQSIATPRFYTILLTIFALLAFALTLVGVYGVASYGMSLRRREFGIRIGLGSPAPSIDRDDFAARLAPGDDRRWRRSVWRLGSRAADVGSGVWYSGSRSGVFGHSRIRADWRCAARVLSAGPSNHQD